MFETGILTRPYRQVLHVTETQIVGVFTGPGTIPNHHAGPDPAAGPVQFYIFSAGDGPVHFVVGF